MKDWMYRIERLTAFCLVMLLAVPFGEASAASPAFAPQTAAASTKGQSQTSAQINDKAADTTNSTAAYPESPTPNQSETQAQPAGQQTTAPAATDAQQSTEPVGTAAAPYVKPEGITGARPTGSVIAPGKQKREHSIAIRVGLIVAAGIAVGTVAALTLGSSSKPH